MKRIFSLLSMLSLSLGIAQASFTIDFEDAYAALGYAADPVNTYSDDGLTINGSYFGLLGGISNGDPGNFDLEGTNGPASLGTNALGHNIDLVFDTQYDITLDVGVWREETANITITAYNNSSIVYDNLDSFVGLNRAGSLGTWYTINFSNVDRINFTATSGSRVWALDNIVAIPEPSTYTMMGLGALLIGAYIYKRRKSA